MRQREQVEEEEAEINMTPMLDIVFIMLIFFIVTAVFVKEAGVDVNRPDAESAEAIKRVSTLIAVTEDNEIWIDKKEVELRDVRATVERLQKENPEGRVVIQGDMESNSGVIIDIMEQLSVAGVRGVAIAALKED